MKVLRLPSEWNYTLLLLLALATLAWTACVLPGFSSPAVAQRAPLRRAAQRAMVRVAFGGTAFRIDVHAVTNRQFREFVAATGYRTTAERRGYGVVYFSSATEPQKIAGACWKQPLGIGSTIAVSDNLPVVHVSWYDAEAYARWAGMKLPTAVQWRRVAEQSRHQPAANTVADHTMRADQATGSVAGPASVTAFAPTADGVFGAGSPGSVREWCDMAPSDKQPDFKPICGSAWIDGNATAAYGMPQLVNAATANNLTGFRCAAAHSP